MSKRFFSIFLIVTINCILSTSCKKETETITVPATVCDVKGVYSGSATASTGATTTLTYKLQDDNLAIGSQALTGPSVTFGGYRNTCDSVFISAYYTGSSSYYSFEGKLLNNNTTISGTFRNVTTPSDFGTFSISK